MEDRDKQIAIDAACSLASFLLVGGALTVASVAALVGCLAAALAQAGYKIVNSPKGKEEGGMKTWLTVAPITLLKSHWDIAEGSSVESSGDVSKTDNSSVSNEVKQCGNHTTQESYEPACQERLNTGSGDTGNPKPSEEHLNQYVDELLDKGDEPK